MPRRLACASLVALLLASVAIPLNARRSPGGGGQDQAPVFRAGVTFVNVDVYPRRDGRIVEGLNQNDFEVFEDGKPQAVSAFEFIRVEPLVPDVVRRDPNSQKEGDALAADPHNRVFVVYLDLYHTTREGSRAARRPVVDFLSRTIGANDLFAVTTPDIAARQLTFGRRLETIERELMGYADWGQRTGRVVPATAIEQKLESCSIGNAPSLGAALVSLHREDQMSRHLQELVTRLRDLRDERKNVLFVSEGWYPIKPEARLNNAASAPRSGGRSPLPPVGVGRGGSLDLGNQHDLTDSTWCDQQIAQLSSIDFGQRFRDLLQDANRANVSFYPIDVGGLHTGMLPLSQGFSGPGMSTTEIANQVLNLFGGTGTTGSSADDAVAKQVVAKLSMPSIQTLQELAENTDGRAVVNTNDIEAGVRRIADDLSAYYLLGYNSTNQAADGKYRRIEVKIKSPGVRLTARHGYLAPTLEVRAAAAAAAAAPPAVPLEISGALGALRPADNDAEVMAYGARTVSGLDVVAELSSAQFFRPGWGSGADVRVAVSSAGGRSVTASGRIDPASRGAVLHVPLPAGEAGPWHASVAVATAAGSLDARTEIAASDADAHPLTGAVIVFRGTSASRVPLRPVADFQFRRSERLRAEWPALAALDQRTARVLDRRGRAMAIEATVTDAGAAVAVDLPLAPFAEGEYVIELTAGQGTRTDRRLLAFRVLR